MSSLRDSSSRSLCFLVPLNRVGDGARANSVECGASAKCGTKLWYSNGGVVMNGDAAAHRRFGPSTMHIYGAFSSDSTVKIVGGTHKSLTERVWHDTAMSFFSSRLTSTTSASASSLAGGGGVPGGVSIRSEYCTPCAPLGRPPDGAHRILIWHRKLFDQLRASVGT